MTSILSFHTPTRRTAVATPAATEPASTTSRERLWLPVAVVLAALIAVAGWLLLVSPVRDDAAAATDQAAAVTAQADTLQARVATLQGQQADLPRYRAELAAAQAALPTTSALPAFLRSLQDLGTSTGTSVTTLAATEPTAPTGAQNTTAAGVGAVYRIPVTVTVSGGQDGLTAFVAALQQDQPRAVLIDSISENSDGDATSITLIMTAFVAPTAGS